MNSPTACTCSGRGRKVASYGHREAPVETILTQAIGT